MKKCVMILSDKSSGSSILQNELLKSPDVNIVRYTRHNEMETLYWNKAVAALGLPQVNMKYSELPMTCEKACKDLSVFLKNNIPDWEFPGVSKEALFEGWERLCRHFGPVFLEKSPHHLHYWEALKLIIEMTRSSDIDFYFIGLIRNPLDTLYSSWRRWGADPGENQFEWLRAYKNLLEFKAVVGDRLMLIKYEKLVSDISTIQAICKFIGIDGKGIGSGFHRESLHKWKTDKYFGFQLSDEVMSFANRLGYEKYEITNISKQFWPLHKPLYMCIRKVYNYKPMIKAVMKIK